MTLTSVIPLGLFIFLFLCCNVYIAFWIYQCVHYLFPGLGLVSYITVSVLLLALAAASFVRSNLPVSPSVKYGLNIYGAYWIGAFIYLLILFVLSDLVLLILGTVHAVPFPAGQKLRCFSGIVVMAFTAVIIICGVIHANNVVHRSYTVQTDKYMDGRDWNIVLISDIHLGAANSEARLAKIVNEINTVHPDIVCIAGDLFDNDINAIQDKARCAELLKKIDSRYGVYACMGNHDRGETEDEMGAFTAQCGITLLEERCTVIDDSLILAGRLDLARANISKNRQRGDLTAFTAGEDISLPVVVMDHNPSHIDEYPGWVDLLLCGHTHRGQLFPGCLFTKRLFTVDYGQYRKDADSPTVIVTSGAGTWGPPIRVGTDSEIVSVKLTQGN